jgi:Undecaprenyl-phosphate glucose phosphotransferase
VSIFSEAAPPLSRTRNFRHAGASARRSSRPAIGPSRSGATFSRALYSVGFAAADGAVILASALAAGLLYQHDERVWGTLAGALFVATLFLGINLLSHEYEIPSYLSLKGHAERAFRAWVTAYGLAITLGFLTKTSEVFSRGATGIQFFGGFAALMLFRNLIVRRMRQRAEAGAITSRRIMLVGSEGEILGFLGRHQPEQYGLKVVGAAVLRPGVDNLADDLALAVATARLDPPDEVFLLLPWGDTALLSRCVDMFRTLPSDIHLGPTAFLERYGDLHIDRSGPIASVHLVRSPLSPFDIACKRVFDVVVASTALLVLSPFLLLVALAIKIESRGPVFFLQRRYGFNQQPFRILKFRSMSTMEDGAAVRQVTTGDKRVTRVGRVLRKTSIDELPQLINVLKGDMSIVGPRPHALAHDQQFERNIASYARRHNVKPGITGWAQVRGWRGETDTPEKIAGRVEHDFQYIDNWSFWFDLAIILRTVFSPRTFHNAK